MFQWLKSLFRPAYQWPSRRAEFEKVMRAEPHVAPVYKVDRREPQLTSIEKEYLRRQGIKWP